MAQHAHWHPSAIEILFSGLEKAVREGKTGDNNFQPVVYQSIASDLREAGFSFNVEQARGDIHNLLIVLIHEKNYSVQEAMDDVDRWYTGRQQDFIRLMKELPKSGDKEIDDNLEKYVWLLGNWVTANYEWSFKSKRFFGAKNDEVHKERVVELLPRQMIAVA